MALPHKLVPEAYSLNMGKNQDIAEISTFKPTTFKHFGTKLELLYCTAIIKILGVSPCQCKFLI